MQILVIESPSGPGKGSEVSLERDINGAVHVNCKLLCIIWYFVCIKGFPSRPESEDRDSVIIVKYRQHGTRTRITSNIA